MVFDILKVKTLKSKLLSSVATKWPQFKSKLTIVYVYGARIEKSPGTEYSCIDEKTWQFFIQT